MRWWWLLLLLLDPVAEGWMTHAEYDWTYPTQNCDAAGLLYPQVYSIFWQWETYVLAWQTPNYIITAGGQAYQILVFSVPSITTTTTGTSR